MQINEERLCHWSDSSRLITSNCGRCRKILPGASSSPLLAAKAKVTLRWESPSQSRSQSLSLCGLVIYLWVQFALTQSVGRSGDGGVWIPRPGPIPASRSLVILFGASATLATVATRFAVAINRLDYRANATRIDN